MYRLNVWVPGLELGFGVVEDVTGFRHMSEGLTDVAGNNRCVVKKVQETSTMPGEDDLLLSAFDRGGEVEVVRFLELLPSLAKVSD